MSILSNLTGIHIKIRGKDIINTLKSVGALNDMKSSLRDWLKNRALNIPDSKLDEISYKISNLNLNGTSIPAPLIKLILEKFEQEMQDYAVSQVDDYLK